MHDIRRKSMPARYVGGCEEGRQTLDDEVSIQRTLDGDPETGNRPFDVERYDKSVLKDGDFRRNFERDRQLKLPDRVWTNKWARE